MLRWLVKSCITTLALLNFEIAYGMSWIGNPTNEGMIPTIATIKTLGTKSKEFCAIECAKTNSCKSFSFGIGVCSFWDAKYRVEDKLMVNKTGHTYYHLNPMPEATELKIIETSANFEEAWKTCKTLRNGNLVSIVDIQMQRKVIECMNKSPHITTVWIGLNGTVDGSGPKTSDGAFKKFDLRWADGNVFTAGRYQHFVPTDPNVAGYACVLLSVPGLRGVVYGWGDDTCLRKWPFICQFASSE